MAQLVNIERRFNKSYIEMIDSFLSGFPETDLLESEIAQKQAFTQSFEFWFDHFTENEDSLLAPDLFYNAVGDNHELLLKNDERLFDRCPDFFAHAFRAPGIESWDFYNSFDSGVGPDGELLEVDAKANLWETLIGLYRLSTILCVYLKMPMVKQIMDMLISENSDISPQNIVQKVVSNFNNNRKMRKLIIQIMNSTEDEDSFKDIFSSLQRIIASLAGKINLNPAQSSQDQINKVFNETLLDAGVTNLQDADKTTLLDALASQNEIKLGELVHSGCISKKQKESLCQSFASQKVQQTVTQSRMVGDLGATMEQMMEAYKSGDTDKMQTIFSKTAPNLGISKTDMARFQQECEEDFEKQDSKSETPESGTPDSSSKTPDV